MTAPSHYYEGLLAAVRPHEPRVSVPPSGELSPATAPPPAAPGESLSWEELVKRHLHPLDSFARLLDCVAANRPPEADDRFRFQWFGLFYQAPAQDAFTLRLRLPGGRVKPWQLAGLADLTQRHASGHILCNSLGGLDVPGVSVTSVVDALVLAESLGFDSRRTGGDCVLAIRGGELEDLSYPSGQPLSFYPLVCALEQICSLSPTLSDLPRPCQIVFAGEHENTDDGSPPAIDTLVVRVCTDASHPFSFLLHFPGSTHGFRLISQRVVPACLELLKAWAAGADRSSRAAAGLHEFAAGATLDALDAPLAALPPRPKSKGSSADPDKPRGCPAPEGRLLSTQLSALVQRCQTHEWREIRILHGQLYAVGQQGEILAATAELREAIIA